MYSSTQTEEIEKGGAEFENAIRQTGFGSFNIKLIILCGLCMMTAITESISMSYIITSAQCDLHLQLSDKTLIASIGFLGMTISCLFWGFLADLLGRKKLIVIATFFSFVFGIASSMASKAWLLIVFRFFNGVFNSCPAAIIFTYVSECHSNKYRTKAISWIGSFIAVTYFYLPCMAWLILTINWPPYAILTINLLPWRLLIIILTFPNIIFCVTFCRFPESPKFLWSIGKSKECLDILRKIYETNTRQDKESYPVNEFLIQKTPEELLETSNSPKSFSRKILSFFKLIRDKMLPLFILPLLPKTVLSSLLQFGILLSGLGVIAWFPEIVNRVELYEQYFSSSSATICESIDHFRLIKNMQEIQKDQELMCSNVIDEDVFKITIIYGVLSTLFFTIIGFIISKVGAKMILVLILSITGISGLLVDFMKEYNLKIIFLITYLFCGMASNTAFAIQVDLFPTEHRAKAVAFAQMMGRFGSTMGSLLTGALIKLYCPLIFYLFSALLLVLIIVTLLLPVPLIICKRKTEEQ